MGGVARPPRRYCDLDGNGCGHSVAVGGLGRSMRHRTAWGSTRGVEMVRRSRQPNSDDRTRPSLNRLLTDVNGRERSAADDGPPLGASTSMLQMAAAAAGRPIIRP